MTPSVTPVCPTPPPVAPPAAPYALVPRGLLSDLRDTPLAIGIYILIYRLVFLRKAAVPLSFADVARYDPAASRTKILRAVGRLVRAGWLIEQQPPGKKATYLPTWGVVAGAPRPWDAAAPSAGRPRHIDVYRIPCALLDIGIGRLEPHARHVAIVSRYVAPPLLGLADIGVYALAVADVALNAPTAALLRLGLMSPEGAARPVPDETTLLALASQRALVDGAAGLTPKGFARAGFPAAPPAGVRHATSSPLFFVPEEMIGDMIGNMIDHLIDDRGHEEGGDCAPVRPDPAPDPAAAGSHGLSGTQTDRKEAPPPPPAARGGGGPSFRPARSPGRRAPQAPAAPAGRPASAQLLRDIGMQSPALLGRLSQIAPDIVERAIATARSRPSTRDVAAVVGRMLGEYLESGTAIPPPVPAAAPPSAVDFRASFAALGYQLDDLDEPCVDEPDAPDELDEPAADATAGEGGADAAGPDPAPASDPEGMRCANQLRTELRWRLPVTQRSLLPAIHLQVAGADVTVVCPSPHVLSLVQDQWAILLGDAARDVGLGGAVRYRVSDLAG